MRRTRAWRGKAVTLAVLRILTLVVICAGLSVPGTHGIALCFESDGTVDVEAAVEGACVGASASCCDELPGDRPPLGFQAREHDHCGDCRDVVLNSGGAGTPLPPARIAGGSAPSAECDAVLPAASGAYDDHCFARRRSTPPPETSHRAPPADTVVLRL